MIKALKGKKIFTGTEVINHGVVVFEDDKILAVGSQEEVNIPAHAAIVDYTEETILPGLIDCHTHLTLSAQISNYAAAMKDEEFVLLLRGARNMRADLLSGVTTMRALGEKNFIDVALKEASEREIIPAPRLLISGKGIRSSFGHGIMGAPFDGPEEVRKAARVNIHDAGADQIKLFVTGSKGEFRNFKFGTEAPAERNEMHCLMTKEEIQAAVDTAHSVGKKVAAHCYGGIGLHYCVEAGVDTIEHGIYMDDEDIEMMAENGTWLTITLNSYFSDQRLINRGTPELTRGFVKYRDSIRTAYQKVLKAGLKYGLGTDAQHGEFAFELENLVGFGVSPLEALKAATSNAARLCGVEDKVGTLEPGKFADIITIKGDPLSNISDIRKVNAVYKGGRPMNQISTW